jgi:hypothetical protein
MWAVALVRQLCAFVVQMRTFVRRCAASGCYGRPVNAAACNWSSDGSRLLYRGVLASALAVVVLLAACTPGPVAGADSVNTLSGSAVRTVRGLQNGCTPTGADLCFNAKDDNCDGVVDEGCGEPTGVVQVLAAWSEANVDVSLDLALPTGQHVNAGTRALAGFRFDRDCPRENCAGQNYESIVSERPIVGNGTFTVEVRLEALGAAVAPIVVNLSARVGSALYTTSVELTPLQDKATAAFSL